MALMPNKQPRPHARSSFHFLKSNPLQTCTILKEAINRVLSVLFLGQSFGWSVASSWGPSKRIIFFLRQCLPRVRRRACWLAASPGNSPSASSYLTTRSVPRRGRSAELPQPHLAPELQPRRRGAPAECDGGAGHQRPLLLGGSGADAPGPACLTPNTTSTTTSTAPPPLLANEHLAKSGTRAGYSNGLNVSFFFLSYLGYCDWGSFPTQVCGEGVATENSTHLVLWTTWPTRRWLKVCVKKKKKKQSSHKSGFGFIWGRIDSSLFSWTAVMRSFIQVCTVFFFLLESKDYFFSLVFFPPLRSSRQTQPPLDCRATRNTRVFRLF